MSLFSPCDILSLTLPVSKQLQGIQIDFQSARLMITDVISVLKTKRTNFDHFASIFALACERMKGLGVPVVQPRVSKRLANRANPAATTLQLSTTDVPFTYHSSTLS